MKRAFCITISLLIMLLSNNATARVVRDTLHTGGSNEFVANCGQWDPNVLFSSQLHDAAIFLESDCFTIVVREPAPKDAPFHHTLGQRKHAYKVHFNGANNDHKVFGTNMLETYSNYYYGKNPHHWASHVPHYRTIVYSNIYPGIDLRVYSAEHALKYDFIVHPGASTQAIRLFYDGVEGLRLRNGDLQVRTSVNDVVEVRPYAYQEGTNGEEEIHCRYHINGNEVSFSLDEYDKLRPLIIDPTLIFSTYTGSKADNWGTTATYDSYKNAYTAGVVFDIHYPTSTGAYDTTFHGQSNNVCDVGIFKFDPTGSQRLFATYLGGEYCDMPHSMFVNSFDELLILGTTGSSDFPTTPGAFDTTFNSGATIQYLGGSNMLYPNGSDIFVSRFSSDGTQLQASTFIGGSDNDGLNYRTEYNSNYFGSNGALYNNYGDGARGELITDNLNNVYVGSTTFSSDFPVTTGCLQPSLGGMQDGVIFKLDYNLKNLLWSTFLGGSNDDAVYSIDTDNEYNVVVCGGTGSSDFPTTTGSFQNTFGGGRADGFFSKISYQGDQLMGSTYMGSNEYDQIYFVRCGKDGDIFGYGQTNATGSTWIYNANYNTPNSGMLLIRLSGDLTGRIWSTVFGTANGKPNLSPTAFGVDICNRIYAVGWGRDFVPYTANWNTAGTWNMSVTPNAYQNTTDGQDFYLISLDRDAAHLEYATFFGELHPNDPNDHYHGSDHVDGGTSRFDRLGTLYQSVCAGCGGSDNFPTSPGVWSDTNGSSNCNNALFRFNINEDFPVAEFVAPPSSCAPYTVNFHNTGRGTRYHWDFGDGDTSSATNPTHTFLSAGLFTIRLIAYLSEGCSETDTFEVQLRVLGNNSHHESQLSCVGNPVQIGTTPMLGCSYHWIEGNVSDSTIANPFVNETGTYILTIIADQGGCSETDTFSVSFMQLLDTLILTPAVCPGENSGTALAIPAQTHGNVQYYWDGVFSYDNYRQGLLAGNHVLVMVDSLCAIEKRFSIEEPPLPVFHKEISDIICQDCNGGIQVEAADRRGMPFHYLWDDGCTDSVRTNLCEGTYPLIYKDTNGCTYHDTSTIVLSHLLDNVSVWSDDSVVFSGLNTQLHATFIEGATYQWSPSLYLNNPNTYNPIATPDETTLFSLVITDKNGCTDTLSLLVKCIEVTCGKEDLFIPNIFTPNGDGLNDQLCFRNQYVTDFKFLLYNRWGELVFESNDVNQCWDGRYKESDCPAGVYMYTCRYKCINGIENETKGDVTLIR